MRLLLGVAAAAAFAATSAFGGSGAGTITAFAATGKPGYSGVPAASGRCSEAAARRIVGQLRLGDPSVADPFGKVLCGAFAGPGSRVMVVMLRGPGNTGFVDWVVFRWAGGTWQFLMKQPWGASITAAGSDIRQTLPIYRLSDSRCCPTGGTKTRIWHWNGARFVASPWKQIEKQKAGPNQPSRFDSPSRNIHCSMFDGGGDYTRGVGCRTDTPRRMVHMNADGRLKISGIPAAWCGCDEADFPPLAYGRQVTVGRFRCLSLEIGVRCTVIRSGKGFLINRDGVSRVGQ